MFRRNRTQACGDMASLENVVNKVRLVDSRLSTPIRKSAYDSP